MRPFFAVAWAVPFLLLTACTSLATHQSSGVKPSPPIGPYHRITARIMVMEPKHIWQAMLYWQTEQPGEGKIRIVHAVSGRIVELFWRHTKMWLRDNQAGGAEWRRIGKEKLITYGIVISPQELSELLGGHVPSAFQPRGSDRWIINRDGNHIRVEWNAQKKRLIFSDIKHGYKATLIILKSRL